MCLFEVTSLLMRGATIFSGLGKILCFLLQSAFRYWLVEERKIPCEQPILLPLREEEERRRGEEEGMEGKRNEEEWMQ